MKMNRVDEQSRFVDFQELHRMLGIGERNARRFAKLCDPVCMQGKYFYVRASVEREIRRAIQTGRMFTD